MLKKLLLVTLVGVGVGILVHYFFGAIPLVNALQPIITPIYDMWASIPAPLKGLLTLGIPALVTFFFAWSKNRAMQKLQQTQFEASQRVGQLQGEKLELEGTVKGYEQVYGKTVTGEIRDMATELRDTQTLLTQKAAEIRSLENKYQELLQIRSRLEEEKNILISRVAELEAKA